MKVLWNVEELPRVGTISMRLASNGFYKSSVFALVLIVFFLILNKTKLVPMLPLYDEEFIPSRTCK